MIAACALATSCATASGGRGEGRDEAQGEGGGRDAAGVGRPIPALTFDRLTGSPLSLAALHGKVVLLDVWASWCAPCKQELPMLDDIARRLGPRGVEILAVSIDQDLSNLKSFLGAKHRWNLTVAHDPKGAIADTLQPDKMPTSYVIDRHGIVRYIQAGFVPSDAAAIERRLADLAAEAP